MNVMNALNFSGAVQHKKAATPAKAAPVKANEAQAKAAPAANVRVNANGDSVKFGCGSCG